MPKRPLIIDTDTGCGFVHAAMLVAGCGLFDIKGACTVYGSTTAKRAAVHAAYLRDLCADYYPVVSGAEKPILVRRKNSMSPDDCSALEDTEGMYTFSPDPEERAWDFIYRTAVSVLGLIIVPDKESVLLFIFFLGWFPIFKMLIDGKLRPVPVLLIKLAVFNASVLLMYWLILKVFVMDQVAAEFSGYSPFMYAAVIILSNITVIILDFALSKIVFLYTHVWRKKLVR